FFFFQAEDGIRDFHVTGVQTCALPIWRPVRLLNPVPPGSGQSRSHPGDPAGLSEDARPRRYRQLLGVVGATGQAFQGLEAMVPVAGAWAGEFAPNDPQPCELEREPGGATQGRAGFRDSYRADAFPVHLPSYA